MIALSCLADGAAEAPGAVVVEEVEAELAGDDEQGGQCRAECRRGGGGDDGGAQGSAACGPPRGGAAGGGDFAGHFLAVLSEGAAGCGVTMDGGLRTGRGHCGTNSAAWAPLLRAANDETPTAATSATP